MRPVRRSRPIGTRARRGMTLTETVTSVFTLVALTTTVFAPALIGLRDRNRQAICTARMGLISRAMLTYAGDYDETPPFMGLGWESIQYPDRPSRSLSTTWGAPGDISTKSKWDWAVAETWITQHPELLWNGTLPEDQWGANGVGIETGLLFPYARTKDVYRCPEFERIPSKSQSAFNYTRTMLGRKWILGPLAQGGKEPDYWGGSDFGAPGPIMRMSQIHRPSWLGMLMDEWWWAHVGSPYDRHIPPRDAWVSGGWAAVDCMHFSLADEIGRYHGRAVRSDRLAPTIDPLAVKQGNVACYDGHVEMTRTFWAGLSDASMGQIIAGVADLMTWLSEQVYAQRGVVMVGAPL